MEFMEWKYIRTSGEMKKLMKSAMPDDDLPYKVVNIEKANESSDTQHSVEENDYQTFNTMWASCVKLWVKAKKNAKKMLKRNKSMYFSPYQSKALKEAFGLEL